MVAGKVLLQKWRRLLSKGMSAANAWKSTVTKMAKVIEPYINADDIKASIQCDDLTAAQKATQMREEQVLQGKSFSFETVLSTERNLRLLEKAKKKGFFIRCIYVLTVSPDINVLRVKTRVATGGHPVEEKTIMKRYYRALKLIPELLNVCDVCHIYDNSKNFPIRIFKKRKEEMFYWESELWDKKAILKLVGM